MVVSGAYFWGAPLMEKSQAGTRINTAENVMLSISDSIDEVAKQGGQISIPLNLGGTLRVLEDENAVSYEIETASLNVASTAWVPLDGASPIRQDTVVVRRDEDAVFGEMVCSVGSTCETGITVSDCAIAGTYQDGEIVDVEGEDYMVVLECDNADYDALMIGPEMRVTGYTGIDKAGVLVGRAFPVGPRYKNMFKVVYRELDDLETHDGYVIQIRSSGGTVGSPGRRTLTISRGDVTVTPGASELGGSLTATPVFVSVQ